MKPEIFFLYKSAEAYQELSTLYKIAYIKKMPNGKYRVLSEAGKNLGTYTSRKAAKKRLRQVEYFKHLDKKKKIKKSAAKKLDLTKIEDFSYSAIMRKINQQLEKKDCLKFSKIYKKLFDQYLLDEEKDIEEKSLSETLKQFNEEYDIKFNKKINKEAAAKPLGDAAAVAKYLANIIQFTLRKISDERRPESLIKVKNKISRLNIAEIASKNMPASSSMGQSITFIKHTLFGQDPQYVKTVIDYILRYL
jgi:hypothetical protein